MLYMNYQLPDNVKNLENMKNEHIPKYNKMWKLLVSKPENHNIRSKTVI